MPGQTAPHPRESWTRFLRASGMRCHHSHINTWLPAALGTSLTTVLSTCFKCSPCSRQRQGSTKFLGGLLTLAMPLLPLVCFTFQKSGKFSKKGGSRDLKIHVSLGGPKDWQVSAYEKCLPGLQDMAVCTWNSTEIAIQQLFPPSPKHGGSNPAQRTSRRRTKMSLSTAHHLSSERPTCTKCG